MVIYIYIKIGDVFNTLFLPYQLKKYGVMRFKFKTFMKMGGDTLQLNNSLILK